MTETEEKPNKIPAKFRVSADKTDAEAFFRLLVSDEHQKELAERFNIKPETPKERERARALIFIQTTNEALKNKFSLSPEQKEQLAEAYASLGNYEAASVMSANPQKKAEYQRFWDAVLLPDDEWCQHPDKHKFIKDYVYSVKEKREMPLLACNVCGQWNVLDAPESLIDARRKRAGVVQNYPKFNSIGEAQKWHQQNAR